MSTRTDAIIALATKGLEKHEPYINENMDLQDIKFTVKFRNGWPFRIVLTMNSCHEKGEL